MSALATGRLFDGMEIRDHFLDVILIALVVNAGQLVSAGSLPDDIAVSGL